MIHQVSSVKKIIDCASVKDKLALGKELRIKPKPVRNIVCSSDLWLRLEPTSLRKILQNHCWWKLWTKLIVMGWETKTTTVGIPPARSGWQKAHVNLLCPVTWWPTWASSLLGSACLEHSAGKLGKARRQQCWAGSKDIGEGCLLAWPNCCCATELSARFSGSSPTQRSFSWNVKRFRGI